MQKQVILRVQNSSENDIYLWHRRLGHAGIKKLNSVLNINIKNGLKCETCVKGKSAKMPFNEKGTRANELLERIHSDVCGPISIPSFTGKKYFVTFIDDFSRKMFVYTMHSKSEVYSKFVEFKNAAENQLNRKIKMLRSDNGKEYVNDQFKKLCLSSGIKHQKSVPYSPQQNGLAERANRTLIECMLLDMNLNKKLWAEALYAATEIINAMPNENKKCADEMWFGIKPNIKQFRIFGCRAFVMIPQEKRKKLDSKAFECIYLRKADDSKGSSVI